MTLEANHFKSIANDLVTNKFGAFQKVLIMKTADPVVVGVDPTFSSETGTGIPTRLNGSQFQKQSIELGDFKIVTNASQWSTDPSVDNVEMEFDGTPIIVKSVMRDADDAAYIIIAKKK